MLPILDHLGIYSLLKSHSYILVEFFVVKDHQRDGVLFLPDVDQALTTDKGLSMQRVWHSVYILTQDVLSYLVQN